MRPYGLAVILSVLGHGVLIFLVVWGWGASAEKKVVKAPTYIKATLVQLEQKAKPVAKPIEPPKADNSLQKKQEEAAKKKRQQAADKKKREAALQAQKKAAAQKKAKETERKNQLAKKRAEDEKKKKEAERKQSELDKKLDEQRKAALQKEIEEERQRELERRVSAEKQRIEEAKQAASDAELASSYTSIIDQKVSANWSRPPSARNGMSALLRIQLVPTGRVVAVDIIESSGDVAFDRSARLAVNKAESFPELKNLPNRVFEQSFRVFNLNFEPEDLRQ